MKMSDYENELNTARSIVQGKGILGRIAKLLFGKRKLATYAGAFSLAENQLECSQREQRARESGIPARAEVLKIVDTGILVNHSPVAQLTLKIMPEEGGEFETTVRLVLPRVHLPREGDIIAVKYNPLDTGEVALAR